ncbi:hypothetical protein B0T17DRAFT_537054 [Bombardia bombarda]|uniref:Uncharacterized protein n=1 Tax=Bombardia bombarda TaxID=252184 RepID=A0AA39WMJ4_9PEZI|nr:hypothetical protein B0T17DRAFT_537054 [Bombardia bombarda]
MSYIHLTQTLAESFSALADEVQSLIDRKTILEHKLRYAHEQFQYLADKYAPAVPEVSEALTKLQLPPDLRYPPATATSAVVPLPKRDQPGSTQHQIALVIREGRRAAQQLVANVEDLSKESESSSRETTASPDAQVTMTTMSTVLEQDFTVQGRKGLLACPFSPKTKTLEPRPPHNEPVDDSQYLAGTAVDPTPHQSSDPICTALLEEMGGSVPATAATGASKCPIRYLDKHSPQELAHYVETHKHEIPRSHEVCVRRYQKSEEQIRKLDAKYGNLVSMINDLSHLHQPMLPSAAAAAAAAEHPDDVDRGSHKRVQSWAQALTASNPDLQETEMPVDEDRESHFDRPLRDVRLGESPSRPWGIQVPLGAGPVEDEDLRRPESPSPAPVRMHSPLRAPRDDEPRTAGPGPGPGAVRKCPFDHTKLGLGSSFPKLEEATSNREGGGGEGGLATETERPFTPVKNRVPSPSAGLPRPTFVNPTEVPMPKSDKAAGHPPPQMVFNISGPVFIGYPMEQAIQFLQRSQGQ